MSAINWTFENLHEYFILLFLSNLTRNEMLFSPIIQLAAQGQ